MSTRRRLLIFAPLLVALVGVAVLLTDSRGDQQAAPPAAAVDAGEGAKSSAGASSPAAAALAEAERSEQERLERKTDIETAGESAEPAAAQRQLDSLQAQLEPLARRFFVAFSSYEIGRADKQDAEVLRELATARFARSLLRDPPRLPLGVETPPRAELGELQLVISKSAAGEASAAELIGEVRRGGAVELITVELARQDDGWLVAGLSR